MTPALSDLPAAVRREVVAAAAATLGGLPDDEIPRPLRRVRAFAPARRARSGAGPLAQTVEGNPRFRQRVAGAWRAGHEEAAGRLDGLADLAPDLASVELLTGLYLLRPDGWEQHASRLLAAIQEGDEARQEARAEAGARAEVDRLRRQVAQAQQGAQQAQQALAAVQEELAGVRRELRRARSDADRARAAGRAAEQQAAQELSSARTLQEEAAAALEQAERGAREAGEATEQARRAARAGRTMADTRARLLLDAVVEAATGLRRELALPPVDVLPADLVDAERASPGEVGAGPARGLAADDPAVLDELLLLPRAHLVVDGYNVTKTGYPALPLLDQRHRLVEALVRLKVRTSSEVTCCFDGAELDNRSRVMNRGVRVLFSEPGSSADELIGRVVRAEPPGRTVVVVTSDQEVVRSVRAAGARALPSTALLRLLGRS